MISYYSNMGTLNEMFDNEEEAQRKARKIGMKLASMGADVKELIMELKE